MAKRKKKITKTGLNESLLYRAMMKKKYQHSQNVGNPWGTTGNPITPPETLDTSVSGGGGYSVPSGIAYDAAGAVDTEMTAQNISNLEAGAAAEGTGVNPYAAAGKAAELVGEGIVNVSPEQGKRGKLSKGNVGGKTLAGAGKGAATGAALGAVVGGGVFSVPAAGIGAVGGAIVGGLSSFFKAKKESKEGNVAWAQSNIGGGQNFLAQQENQFAQEQQQNQQTRDANSNQGDVLTYNAFAENPFPGMDSPTLMGQEGKYENSGKILALSNYKSEIIKANQDLRSKIRGFSQSLSSSGGGGMEVSRTPMGNPYGANIGGGASVNSGKFGMNIGGGGSPSFGPQGVSGVNYGGGAKATYNPNPNLQLNAGVGTGGYIGQGGASTPQVRPSIGVKWTPGQYQRSDNVTQDDTKAKMMEYLRQISMGESPNSNMFVSAPNIDMNSRVLEEDSITTTEPILSDSLIQEQPENFNKGGNVSHHRGHLIGEDGQCMTCPQGYEAGGNIEDEYTNALNNISQGYIPNKKRQKENQFAQQLGPNREITEPGVYQVNGPTHEEGGTMETVPTLKGPEKAEFDDKEFLETTVGVGGMETFAFNNHEGDKDADIYARIQKEYDKIAKELEVLGEMNPEYLKEIKKALT